jgi:hypothetical protein
MVSLVARDVERLDALYAEHIIPVPKSLIYAPVIMLLRKLFPKRSIGGGRPG